MLQTASTLLRRWRTHVASFWFEEKSGCPRRRQDGINSAAVFLARWVVISGANVGNGGSSRTRSYAERKIEGTFWRRQLRSSQECRHHFSLRKAPGGRRRCAGNSRQRSCKTTHHFGCRVRSDRHDRTCAGKRCSGSAGDAEYALCAGCGNDGPVQRQVRKQATSRHGHEVL